MPPLRHQAAAINLVEPGTYPLPEFNDAPDTALTSSDQFRWRVKVLLDEIALNFRARAAVTTLLMVIGLAGLFIADIVAIDELERREEHFVATGVNVYVARASGGISAHRCHALSEIDGVSSSGALRFRSSTVTPNLDQNVGVQVIEATPGTIKVLDPRVRGMATVWASEHLVDSIGSGAGSYLDLQDAGLVLVGGVVRNEPRAVFMEKALLVVVPPQGEFDSCWLETERAATGRPLAILGTAVVNSENAEIGPLANRGNEPPLSEALRRRPTRTLSYLVGVMLGLTIGISTWVRRGDLAVYRALGTRTYEMGIMTLGESVFMAWLSVPTSIAIGILTLDIDSFAGARLLGVYTVLSTAGMACLVGGLLGWLIGLPRHIDTRLKTA